MINAERLADVCLCNVMPDVCDECVEKVLANYSCPVCSVLLPMRVPVEMGIKYFSIVLRKSQE